MAAEDLTHQFNTYLTPEQERLYQLWKIKNGYGKTAEFDYDLRGAWLANDRADGKGHWTDEYKKPNHPTFSTHSNYYGMDMAMSTNKLKEHKPTYGGQWYGNIFFPTEDNIENIKGNQELETDDSQKWISGIDSTATIMNPYYKDPNGVQINFDADGNLMPALGTLGAIPAGAMGLSGDKVPYTFVGALPLSDGQNSFGFYSVDQKRPANGKIYSMYTAEYNTPDKTYSISHGRGIKGDKRTTFNFEKRF